MTSLPDDGREKKALRKYFLKARANLAAAQRADANRRICSAFSAWVRQASEALEVVLGADAYIGAYLAFGHEVDLFHLWSSGPLDMRPCVSGFAFPKVQSQRRLSFYAVTEGAIDASNRGFAKNAYGIYEPDEACANHILPRDIRIVLVPGVGFTESGARLGYGGGYYDRWLAQPEVTATRIGVCYEAQVGSMLPIADHDVKMQYLLTEMGIRRCT